MAEAASLKCSVCCQRPTTSAKFALGRFWCQNHFCCNLCNTALTNVYHTFAEKAYCNGCFRNVVPKCKSCGKPLTEGKEYRKATDEAYWHLECFLCSKCNKQVNVSKFALANNKLICAECAQN
ncbi:LIM domain containing protein [Trichuris trichiura]|uniref:LIM domain containing protein n=1 Tax=Trichuris trichiura TaxID=36087 RepID=A0A077ZHL3_TRITR|nr:LIM domain containing protein [Trichuris trichiura]